MGSYNTAIGAFAGQSGTGNIAYLLAIGYYAAAGTYGTAVGANTKAIETGSVALGTDSGGVGAQATAQDGFVLGTANHKVKVPGRLNVAPRTPTGSADAQGTVGDIATDDSYVYIRKRSALTTF